MLDRFLRDLGRVNPALAILDTAMARFSEHAQQHEDPTAFLRATSARAGHHKLMVSPTILPQATRLLHLTHVAYIVGRSDTFCDELRRHPMIVSAQAPSKGDFLRKTVYCIHRTASPRGALSDPPSDQQITEHLPLFIVRILDYYRVIRNEELHDDGAGSGSGGSINMYEEHFKAELSNTRQEVRKIFGASPSAPDKISSQDVLLFSKAWQVAARALCSTMFNADMHLKPLIRGRFGHLSAERRINGARGLLKQEFLLDDHQVNVLLNDVGWS
jgi:hypothetical protein